MDELLGATNAARLADFGDDDDDINDDGDDDDGCCCCVQFFFTQPSISVYICFLPYFNLRSQRQILCLYVSERVRTSLREIESVCLCVCVAVCVAVCV